MKRGGPLKRRTPLRRVSFAARGKPSRKFISRRSERQDQVERLHSLVKRKVCMLSATFSPQYGFKKYRPAPTYPSVVDLGEYQDRGPLDRLVLPTCARCGRRLPGKYLDLDEVEGRHPDGLIPGAIWPPGQQLLCRGCHDIKPTEDGGHVNYCETHQPQVHQRLLALGAEIKLNMPAYPYPMKPSLDTLHEAILKACTVVYV